MQLAVGLSVLLCFAMAVGAVIAMGFICGA